MTDVPQLLVLAGAAVDEPITNNNLSIPVCAIRKMHPRRLVKSESASAACSSLIVTCVFVVVASLVSFSYMSLYVILFTSISLTLLQPPLVDYIVRN